MKNAKRSGIIAMIFAIMLLGILALGAAAQQRTLPIINASLITQEPYPVGPGQIVELRFRIENKGGLLAKDVQAELLSEYPFSIREGENAMKNIGTLESLQSGNDGATVTYRIIVDKSAPDGDHEIRLRYKEGGSNSWITFDPFIVRVQSNIAIISITKVTSIPAMIAPGDKAKLSIELKNYASSLLKDVLVKIDLSGSALSPSGFSNELVIPQIDAQKGAKAEFELIADPDAASGVLKIPVSIAYSDVTGKNFSKTNTISVLIGDTPDISVSLDSSDIYTKDTIGNVVIRVVNKGTTDVKFMNVMIGKPENADVIGSDEAYIGNLDSDDFSTAEFKLYVREAEGSISLPVVIEYKDANNNNYKKESALDLRLYSSKEAKLINDQGGGNYVWIIALAAAMVGFFIYRSWRKRKGQKH